MGTDLLGLIDGNTGFVSTYSRLGKLGERLQAGDSVEIGPVAQENQVSERQILRDIGLLQRYMTIRSPKKDHYVRV